jgi:hypothetical protein
MKDRRVGLAVILTLTITLFALWFGGAFASSGKASVETGAGGGTERQYF